MTLFWILSGLMLVLALFFLIKTLLTPEKTDITGNQELLLYRSRFDELQQDIRNGIITEEDADAARKEMEMVMPGDGKSIQNDNAQDGNIDMKGDRKTAIIVTILLPIFAISLYLYLGQPGLVKKTSPPAQGRSTDSLPADHPSIENEHPSVDKMVARLAERLKTEPDDAEGWWTLANSYMSMERFSDAETAFEQLYRLTGDEPRVLLRYADAMIMANAGRFAGKPEELIDKAMKLDPENATGLWLAGMAAREKGEYKEAIDYWHKLLPKLENDKQSQQEVIQLINGVLQLADGKIDMPSALPVKSTGTDKTDTGTATVATESASIRVSVSLSPEISGEASPDDTLFIFAKPLQGPPMPVAIVRKKVSDLPIEVILDDSLAIMPTNKLSSYDSVNIGARISKSGNAITQSGDLQSENITAKPGIKDTINLVINSRAP